MVDINFEGESFGYNDYDYKVTDGDCIRIIDKYKINDEKTINKLWEIWTIEYDSTLERLVSLSIVCSKIDKLFDYYNYIKAGYEDVDELYKKLRKGFKVYNKLTKSAFQFDDSRKEVYCLYPYNRYSRYFKIVIKARERSCIEIDILFCKTDYDEDLVYSPWFLKLINSFNNIISDGRFLINLNGNLVYRYNYAIVNDNPFDINHLLNHLENGLNLCVDLYDSISFEDILKCKCILGG